MGSAYEPSPPVDPHFSHVSLGGVTCYTALQEPDLAQRGVCAHGRQVFLGVGCENIFPGCGYVWVKICLGENMSGRRF